jgi:Reverse transcriptase (RNA-dependent DNA polymerase)
MSNRLTSFLEQNSLLCAEQFGFRKKHSTLHPLIHFLNNISSAKNKNHYSIAIFCDLRKAFDTVDHEILIKKLHNLGVRSVELEWFRNYLVNRKQFVSINNIHSLLLAIKLGVPQGSILGPLLFLIYINDLPKCNSLSNSLFADDTSLFSSHENLDHLTEFVNIEFQKVIHFFNQHKLSLHKDKTKFMLFFKKRGTPSPNIVFNYNRPYTNQINQDLIIPMSCINDSADQKIKFLGVYIDPFLTFKDHIQVISKKISTGLFFLRSAKNFLSEKSLKYLYFALIHCHLIYAVHIYSCASENLIKKLFILQKKAIRIISSKQYNAHTEPLFKVKGILPLPKLIYFFNLQFMHQYKFNHLPASFNNTWITNSARRAGQAGLTLRDDDLYYVPFSRTNALSRLPMITLPKLWNEFPNNDIKLIANKLEFNKKLKNYLLSSLEDVPRCTCLLCPACHL